jgi:erythrocyte band 7 integral membrane protein
VQEYERAVIFRMGRLRSGGARGELFFTAHRKMFIIQRMTLFSGPGVFFVLPCIDNYCKVDLRTVCKFCMNGFNNEVKTDSFLLAFDVPPQEVLTKDSVTVSVDAVVYYRVCAVASVLSVYESIYSML